MLKILKAVEWQVDHFSEIPVLVIPPCLRGGTRVPPYVPPTPFVGETSYFGRSTPPACRTSCSQPERWAWAHH